MGVRVVLAGLPRMLENILSARLSAEPDVEVFVCSEEGGQVAEALERYHPEVLITDEDRSELARALDSISTAEPSLKLFAVSQAGRNTSLYELAPVRRDLGELSPSALVRSIFESIGRTDRANIPGSRLPASGDP